MKILALIVIISISYVFSSLPSYVYQQPLHALTTISLPTKALNNEELEWDLYFHRAQKEIKKELAEYKSHSVKATVADEKEKIENTVLVIYNLDPKTNIDDLNKLFDRVCKIENARIVVDKNSGLSKGFAFVTIDSNIPSSVIYRIDHSEVMGRSIRVKIISEDNSSEAEETYDNETTKNLSALNVAQKKALKTQILKALNDVLERAKNAFEIELYNAFGSENLTEESGQEPSVESSTESERLEESGVENSEEDKLEEEKLEEEKFRFLQ